MLCTVHNISKRKLKKNMKIQRVEKLGSILPHSWVWPQHNTGNILVCQRSVKEALWVQPWITPASISSHLFEGFWQMLNLGEGIDEEMVCGQQTSLGLGQHDKSSGCNMLQHTSFFDILHHLYTLVVLECLGDCPEIPGQCLTSAISEITQLIHYYVPYTT